MSTGTGFAQPISGTPVSDGDQRKHDGANQVDVDRRVERQPAEHARRRIAQLIRRPRVRRLVHDQRAMSTTRTE